MIPLVRTQHCIIHHVVVEITLTWWLGKMCMWHSGLCYLVHFFSRLLIELKADQFFVNSLRFRAHIENPLGAKFLNSPSRDGRVCLELTNSVMCYRDPYFSM